METSYKLTGNNTLVDFSTDAHYIIISGYDGGLKSLIPCKTESTIEPD